MATALKPVAKKVAEFAKKACLKFVEVAKSLASKLSVALKNAKEKSKAKKQAKAKEKTTETVEVTAEEPIEVTVAAEKEDVQNNETEN